MIIDPQIPGGAPETGTFGVGCAVGVGVGAPGGGVGVGVAVGPAVGVGVGVSVGPAVGVGVGVAVGVGVTVPVGVGVGVAIAKVSTLVQLLTTACGCAWGTDGATGCSCLNPCDVKSTTTPSPTVMTATTSKYQYFLKKFIAYVSAIFHQCRKFPLLSKFYYQQETQA